MKKLTKFLGIAFLAMSILSCSDDNESQPTIVDIASGDAQFSTLVRALERTDLVETLDGSGQFTVFAPTNAAFTTFFNSLGAGVTVENVDAAVLKKILLNHVIGTEIKSIALPTGTTYAKTLSPINSTDTSPTVSMFVQKSGSTITLNGGASNGGATVTSLDIDASNGVIHVVGNVIAIPTLENHLIANPDLSLSTFVEALQITGLVDTFNASSDFTVFAPTNAAFEALLGPGVSVNTVPVPVLTELLKNHVLGQSYTSSELETRYYKTLAKGAASTTNTLSMYIDLTSGVMINGGGTNGGANVVLTKANIVVASIGVIHVVDRVIAIPTLVNHVIANPDFDTLEAVLTSTGGAFGDQSAVLNALLGLTAAAPATLFAPNNAALATATGTSGFANGATPVQVSTVLQYHVTTAGNVLSSQLTNNQVVPMFTSPVQDVTVILGSGTVDVKDTANNLSRVFQADIQASNGVIHGVDRVLQPAL